MYWSIRSFSVYPIMMCVSQLGLWILFTVISSLWIVDYVGSPCVESILSSYVETYFCVDSTTSFDKREGGIVLMEFCHGLIWFSYCRVVLPTWTRMWWLELRSKFPWGIGKPGGGCTLRLGEEFMAVGPRLWFNGLETIIGKLLPSSHSLSSWIMLSLASGTSSHRECKHGYYVGS